MSRIGKKPITLPQGVTLKAADKQLTVTGPKGSLSMQLHPDISLEQKDGVVRLSRSREEKYHRALHGMSRALVQNMVRGVTEGYSRKLELVGVGYRAELKGKSLQLLLGFSHPILFQPPEGIKIETPTQTSIIVSGIEKELVGMVASKIRSFRPPEPYKGKGVKYEGEYIRRKAGKAAAAGGAKS